MKPMIKYRGGKSKELKEITPFIPRFSGKYIEPFFGGGALFFNLEPEKAIINDINKPLIDFYRGIKYDYDIIKKELFNLEKLYVSNRAEYEERKRANPDLRVQDDNEELYYKIRDLFNNKSQTELHPATVYYFINKTSYSGMIRYNKSGEFNVPYGRYKNFNTDLINVEHKSLLDRTDICSSDYLDIFKKSTKNDFIFLDPPYDSKFSDYGNKETEEGFTEEMHIELSNEFKNLEAKSLMVIGKTELTHSLYKDYVVHEYDKSYAVNIRNRFKSESKHILIANYKI